MVLVMQLLENFSRLLSRFRYPVSLPEDVAGDLGLVLPNTLPFKEFVRILASPSSSPANLRKWMPRFKAEAFFQSAVRREIFKSNSLFSYKFTQGWVVIALYFNEDALLTRLFLQCPAHELDLPLEEDHLLYHAENVAISSLHALRKKI